MDKKDKKIPFWEEKTIFEMDKDEWESLCYMCGRCCLIKLEYEETGETVYTSVGCKLLDCETGKCKNYYNRFKYVPECFQLDAHNVNKIDWLPSDCIYKILSRGESLPNWHPFISGSYQSVIDKGLSVAGKVISEEEIPEEIQEQYIISWIKPDKNGLK